MTTEINITLRIPKYVTDLRSYVTRKLQSIGGDLEARAKDLVSIGNLGGTNPSSPGQPPHLGTGVLRASITHAVDQDGENVTLKIGTMDGPATSYASALEYGTSNMAARPFLRPTLANNTDVIMDGLK